MPRIPLSEIAFDAGTQIRAAINESVVAEYADRMTEGVEFPAIVLFHDGNQHYLADGFHRFMAARRNDFRDINADVRAGTKEDALWFALGANRENGQRLTDADKTHAVAMALREWPEKLRREIAQQVGCSESLVSKIWMRDVKDNTGVEPDRTGQALRTFKKREQIRSLVADGVPSTEIIKKLGTHSTLVAEVRAEMGMGGTDKSKAAVSQRRKDLRDMAERGFTSRQIAATLAIDEKTVAAIAAKEGVSIHADRVVGKTKRHDSTRIVEQMVMDGENLTADVNLIDFASLDRQSLSRWIDSLIASHKSLHAFIRRLKQEQKNVEAA